MGIDQAEQAIFPRPHWASCDTFMWHIHPAATISVARRPRHYLHCIKAEYVRERHCHDSIELQQDVLSQSKYKNFKIIRSQENKDQEKSATNNQEKADLPASKSTSSPMYTGDLQENGRKWDH